MQATSQFEPTPLTQLRALISDLRWRLRLLDADIQEEERKANAFDPSSLTYPMLALTLRQRRDNLSATVATLQRQLERLTPSDDLSRAA